MKTPKFLPGDFYVAYSEKFHMYKLYRVLIAEPGYGGIHISMYSNLFREIPKSIDTDELSFGILQVSTDGEEVSMSFDGNKGSGSLGDIFKQLSDENNHVGIMHMPLSIEGFDTGDLHFVDHQPLTAEDLEGFATYLDGMGYDEEERQAYVDFIVDRSDDRSFFQVNRWLRWTFPVLGALMIGWYLSGWGPAILPIIGLILIGLLSWLWQGRIMRNISQFYQ